MRIAAASLLVTVLSIGSVAGQTLRVSRTSILNNDPVIVTLAVPSPTGNDVVGLYPAGTVDTGLTRPLKCADIPLNFTDQHLSYLAHAQIVDVVQSRRISTATITR